MLKVTANGHTKDIVFEGLEYKVLFEADELAPATPLPVLLRTPDSEIRQTVEVTEYEEQLF